jgi:hypothetical protein
METRQRASRNAGKRKLEGIDEHVPSYPDGQPCNDIENLVAQLDLETFPITSYARVDDILVYSLFASKRHPDGFRALKPATAFGPIMDKGQAHCPSFTDDHAMEICHIFNYHIRTKEGFRMGAIEDATNDIFHHAPQIFQNGDERVLRQ